MVHSQELINGVIRATLEVEQIFDISGAVEITAPAEPTYEGEYEVQTSLTDDIVLPTANRTLRSDITVRKVGMHEVDNLSGGYTLTIGSE